MTPCTPRRLTALAQRWRLALLALLLPQTGCALFAGKADYADYRTIRLTSDPGERALAMRSYVDKHPHGHWHDSVEAERKSQELKAFEVGKDSRQGLEHYLAAYPDGTYVAQARSRLQAISLIEQQRKQAEQQAALLAQARKERASELRRTWLGRFLGYWIETLSTLQSWGEPIPEVARDNPQFSRAFGALPRPRCTQDECVKYYAGAYAVPVPGGNRIERQLSLLLRLRMRAGKLERAELLLPERGFSRWYELEQRRAVSSGERADREQAIAWAMQRAEPLIEQVTGGVSALASASMPKIDPPAIGSTGELIDTSVEKPTDPQSSLPTADNAGIGVTAVEPQPAPTAEELVKPQTPAATPDMVFNPLGVGKQGQRVQVEVPKAPTAPGTPAADGGNTSQMTFATPLEVPKHGPADSTQPEQAEAGEPQAPDAAPLAPVVRGFQTSTGVQITLFAAGSDGPGYDGVMIERPSKKTPARAVAPKRPSPPSPAPAAAGTPNPSTNNAVHAP